MTKKAIIITRTLPLLLLLVFLAPTIYAYSSLKYPIVSGKLGFIWLILCIFISVINVIICQFCRHETMRIISYVLAAVYILIYIIPLLIFGTYNIYEVFPFESKTEKVDSYCIFDENVDIDSKQDIESFFPEEIPEGAENVEYQYYFTPKECSAMKVRLAFSADKKTYQQLSSSIKGEWSKIQGDNYFAYYDESAPWYYKQIVFEDNGNIEYLYLSFMTAEEAKFGGSFCADGDYYMN